MLVVVRNLGLDVYGGTHVRSTGARQKEDATAMGESMKDSFSMGASRNRYAITNVDYRITASALG